MVGAMAFLECLASMIIDQPTNTLCYLRPFAKLAENQRIFPNPWTGVSTPLFIILAEVATLIRQKRNLSMPDSDARQTASISDLDESITSNATRFFRAALAHSSPPHAKMEETKDIRTPLDHLACIDCVFRLIILLELTQIFPDIALGDNVYIRDETDLQRESKRASLDLAIGVLRLISEVPKTSGTLTMLTIPLVSAGSALQTVESHQCDYKLESTSFSGLRKAVSELANRPLPIAMWLSQTLKPLRVVYVSQTDLEVMLS